MSTVFSGADENAHDRVVASLDPLDADEVMAALPAANADGDTGWILSSTRKLVDGFDTAEPAQARAALRDLGFLAASAVRHTPDADLSFLEPTLLRLGRIADEVPRDTVYSYTTRNPVGRRCRMFEGSPEEDLFIAAVLSSTRALNIATGALTADLARPDLDEERLLDTLGRVHSGVEVLRRELLKVHRAVTPEHFSRRLRPYFPKLDIGGHVYVGPGGAQMPLLVLDVLLLAAHPSGRIEDLDDWHVEYLNDTIPYLPPAHRAVCAAGRAGLPDARSPLSRLVDGSAAVRAAYSALLLHILRFRFPHRQVARNNMAIRIPGSLGSGGYSLTALDNIVEITEDRAAMERRVARADVVDD